MTNTKVSTSDDMETVDKEFFGSKEDHAEDRSVTSRNRLRDKIQNEVENFIAGGGRINEIEPHVTADPPKKPSNSYGSRPI